MHQLPKRVERRGRFTITDLSNDASFRADEAVDSVAIATAAASTVAVGTAMPGTVVTTACVSTTEYGQEVDRIANERDLGPNNDSCVKCVQRSASYSTSINCQVPFVSISHRRPRSLVMGGAIHEQVYTDFYWVYL